MKNRRLILAVVLMACATLTQFGCAADKGREDAMHRFGETGKAIQPYLKPASDPSVQALYDAFDRAVQECLK